MGSSSSSEWVSSGDKLIRYRDVIVNGKVVPLCVEIKDKK